MINSKKDLDAIVGTPEYTAFMNMLAGTLWRVERDDAAQTWVVVEDNSTIERFGFTRADFPNAQPPALPEYTPPMQEVYTCSPWQIRKALNAAGLRQVVEDAVAASDNLAIKDGWEFATEFRSDDPFVLQIGAAIGKSPIDVANLIKLASEL